MTDPFESASSTSRLERICSRMMGQGLSGHQLAKAVAIGTTIGILPTPWGTSLLCLLLAWLLGLNPLVVQTANFLVYPLQVCLFIPFALWGRKLCPTWFALQPDARLSLQVGWLEASNIFLPVQLAALLGWAVLLPGALAISYSLAFWILRDSKRMPKNTKSSQQYRTF